MENLLDWLIISLIFICIGFFVYYYKEQITNILGTPVAPLVENEPSFDDPHSATPLSQVNVHSNKEVFHVAGNRVEYDKAEKVCSQYNSELATYDQILHAYQHGGEWCNYGWSKDQLALYPTQKSTWESIQNAQDEKDRNMCGHYGVNGGKFDKNMKFGVNCYGVRPKEPESDFIHPELPKQKEIVYEEKKEEPIDDLVVVPYNRVRWQRDKHPVMN